MKENRLLVLAARLHLNEEEDDRFHQILVGHPDWVRVLDTGGRLGCLPLLYKHLLRPPYKAHVPPQVMETLHGAFRRATIRGLRIQGQIQAIGRGALQQEIPILFLKGAALAGWLYGDVSLRPMSDIDVLVREKDVLRLDGMLRELGYSQDYSIYKSHVHRDMAPEISHLPPYGCPRGVNVEVHVSLFHDPAMDAALWQDARRPGEGDGFGMPGPVWMLLHLCLHLEKHLEGSGFTLYWFSDIFEFFQRFGGTLDWVQFQGLADCLGAQEKLLRVIGLLKIHWGLKLPAALENWDWDRVRDSPLPLDPQVFSEGFFRNLLIRKQRLFRKAYRDHGPAAALYYGLRILFPPKQYVRNICGDTSWSRFLGIYVMYSYERLRNLVLSVWMRRNKG